MTKNFNELISEYKIVIPLIQRDYAQGRKDELNKANNFLNAILDGTKNGLNLDFIYGKIDIDEHNDTKIFIPLDGQQRLTTLLLIHWFVSLESSYKPNLQNFNYEVRSSTKDFIKKLMSEDSWKSFKKLNLRDSIENANWFFLSWNNDPTVVSILNMIDLIEQKFIDISIDDLDKIVFEFLNLNDFDLTDELYVKMNARGKSLTEFENFKSNFEKFLVFEDIEYEHKTKAKLDNKWLNIFWKIAQEKVEDISEAPKLADKMFYNFFYNVTLNFYLEDKSKLECKIDSKIKEFSVFIDKCSIFDFYEDVYSNKNNVERLIEILDNLEITDEFKIFISDKNISYWDRARFYALSLGYIFKLNKIEFSRWRKVSFNLVNNQLIQSPKNFIDSIQSLKKLSEKNSNDIYKYIDTNPNNIEFFTEVQRYEESLKAHLILKDNRWDNEFFIAESNYYLNGQIGFLLKYANDDFEKFKIYRDKFIALWDCAKKEQVLVYQALLTKGNYLPKLKSNYTFCSFDKISVRDKNDNWKKVFNDEVKREYLKKLLDDIDINNVKQSLESIIQNYLNLYSLCDFENYQDKYLYTLISSKNNITYCTNLQLRYHQDGKEVYLLKRNQMNGNHAELYTYNLYNNFFHKKSFKPFSEVEYYYTTSWDIPFILLDGYKYKKNQFHICIYFDFESEKYEIYFIESNQKKISEKIVDILELNQFKQKEIYSYYLITKYGLYYEDKLVDFIDSFVKKI